MSNIVTILAVFLTRNTTYVVAQGQWNQYIGRFNTEASSLYCAESGVQQPEAGRQAVLCILDHSGRYDRITTSTVQKVVLWDGALLDTTEFLSVSWEVKQTLSFAQHKEAEASVRVAKAKIEAKRLHPAL